MTGIAIVCFACRIAAADAFVAVLGGTTIPVGDRTFRSEVDPSAKVGLRLAALKGELGAALSIDWAPLRENTAYPIFGCGSFNSSTNIVGRQLRVLANVLWERSLSQTARLDIRAGAGIDNHHLTFDYDFMGAFPEHGSYDHGDTGLAFEASAGLWFALGPIRAGGEIAFPLSVHRPDNSYMSPLDYTGVSVDVLLGVRLGMAGNR